MKKTLRYLTAARGLSPLLGLPCCRTLVVSFSEETASVRQQVLVQTAAKSVARGLVPCNFGLESATQRGRCGYGVVPRRARIMGEFRNRKFKAGDGGVGDKEVSGEHV